jgi:hypothetical protein
MRSLRGRSPTESRLYYSSAFSPYRIDRCEGKLHDSSLTDPCFPFSLSNCLESSRKRLMKHNCNFCTALDPDHVGLCPLSGVYQSKDLRELAALRPYANYLSALAQFSVSRAATSSTGRIHSSDRSINTSECTKKHHPTTGVEAAPETSCIIKQVLECPLQMLTCSIGVFQMYFLFRFCLTLLTIYSFGDGADLVAHEISFTLNIVKYVNVTGSKEGDFASWVSQAAPTSNRILFQNPRENFQFLLKLSVFGRNYLFFFFILHCKWKLETGAI